MERYHLAGAPSCHLSRNDLGEADGCCATAARLRSMRIDTAPASFDLAPSFEGAEGAFAPGRIISTALSSSAAS
jgi:hypothetical protein